MIHIDPSVLRRGSFESTDKTPDTALKEVTIATRVTFNLGVITPLPHSRQPDRKETHMGD